jgi:hypothetical protein
MSGTQAFEFHHEDSLKSRRTIAAWTKTIPPKSSKTFEKIRRLP